MLSHDIYYGISVRPVADCLGNPLPTRYLPVIIEIIDGAIWLDCLPSITSRRRALSLARRRADRASREAHHRVVPQYHPDPLEAEW